jgi:hypothetical protein
MGRLNFNPSRASEFLGKLNALWKQSSPNGDSQEDVAAFKIRANAVPSHRGEGQDEGEPTIDLIPRCL